MAKNRKGGPAEEHADESWLLPYSDMMTLLLALFVVMFAMSSVNQSQYNALMESMYTAFGGISDVGSPTELPYPSAGLPNNPEADASQREAAGAQMGAGLSNLYMLLTEYIQQHGLSDTISVEHQGDKVLVTLMNDVFFEPGSAELSPEMRGEARQLAEMIYNSEDPANPFEVIVAGHTDNVPQNPSNWHLSVQRAANSLLAMLDGSQLNPTHFSSRGYGEYTPIDTNDTAEGRQRNRRVELLVSQNTQLAAPASTPPQETASVAAPTSVAPQETASAAAPTSIPLQETASVAEPTFESGPESSSEP